MAGTEAPAADDRLEEIALRRLAVGYAAAVDHRDRAGFLAVFHPGARFETRQGGPDGDQISVFEGHDQLGRIPAIIDDRYGTTFHLIGNTAYEVSGTTATGEVYCIAHHRQDGPEGMADLAVYIRYLDRYRRDPGGRWLIESRQGIFLWTEQRPVLALRRLGLEHLGNGSPEADPGRNTGERRDDEHGSEDRSDQPEHRRQATQALARDLE
jgi:hypothetical protein